MSCGNSDTVGKGQQGQLDLAGRTCVVIVESPFAAHIRAIIDSFLFLSEQDVDLSPCF